MSLLFNIFLAIELFFVIFVHFAKSSVEFYFVFSFFHVVSGLALTFFLLKNKQKIPFWFALVSTISGLALFFTGKIEKFTYLANFHEIASVLFFVLVAVLFFNKTFELQTKALLVTFTVLLVCTLADHFFENKPKVLQKNLYFPSPVAILTENGRKIEPEEINQTDYCKKCHQDFATDFEASVHKLSSFNNLFYKRSFVPIEKDGILPKGLWCAGCHDPALMIPGNFKDGFDKNSSDAQAGISCTLCHSISGVVDATANSNYIFEPPKHYPFAFSENPVLQKFSDYLIELDPQKHRETFAKPFLKDQRLCGNCHKVSFFKEINDYKWKRGHNEFDDWHNSGVSQNNPESFYFPDSPQNCSDCHMPYRKSDDVAAKDGKIRNHRMPAANSDVPFLNGDSTQLEAVKEFLRGGKLKVEIIAARESSEIADVSTDNSKISIPLDAKLSEVPANTSLIFDVVIRNKGVGHKFVTGTIDGSYDWVEFSVFSKNKKILSEGEIKGNEVDSMAHFFRGVLLDKNQEPLRKRDGLNWQTTLYANEIAPSKSTVIHYKVTIPDTLSEVTLVASLNHKKFNNDFLKFVYEDSSEVPVFPNFWIATDTVTVKVGKNFSGFIKDEANWENLNDYGISLLEEDDFLGAEKIFTYLTEIKPDYANGFVNLAISLQKNNKLKEAFSLCQKAMETDKNCVRAKIVSARILQVEGKLAEAEQLFSEVLADFPRARNLWLDLGRTQYLAGKFQVATESFGRVLEFDPESIASHFNLMLCYKALKNEELTKLHEAKFEKFKDDEIEERYLLTIFAKRPTMTRESQKIHVHEPKPVNNF
ncbi:hypothetical protein IT568_05110 [bacterium]|nr:hypothetical protein [bacterium]